ncbi:MAG: PilZ domain-containing protein [Phycisphaerales bacterium]|nr:PilZ domain-containing protein [Phycisphaerales bacterium]
MPVHLDTSDTLRFERRASGRTPVSGSVMALFADQHGPSVLTRLELVDSSHDGLGFRSPVEVQPGDRFTLYSGGIPVAHGAGTVARCIPEGSHYRLGVRCEQRRAA